MPLEMGDLEAGRYTTNAFQPPLIFDLPAGWHQFFPDDTDEVALGGPAAEMNITRPSEVVDPTAGIADAPESMIDWLTQHPRLGGPQPVDTEVGGIASQYVDLAGLDGEVNLFHYPEGNMRLPAGVPARIHVVPLDGPDLVLLVLVPAGSTDLDEAIVATQPILDSLQLGE